MRRGLHQHASFLVGDFFDEIGLDAEAAVGKHAIGRGKLERCDAAGTQCHGEIGRVARRIKAKAANVVACVIRPDALKDAHRHQIQRFGQGAAQAHRSARAAVVVLGLPGRAAGFFRSEGDRRIVYHCCRGVALFQRGGVDEGLETGAGLPPCLGDMVELVAVEIKATDQRGDRPVSGIDCDQRRFHFRQLGQPPGLGAGGLYPYNRTRQQLPAFFAGRPVGHPFERVAGDVDHAAILQLGADQLGAG